MRPILACAVAVAALIWMPASWALGLGDVELRSALNQPLDARIELVSAREGELDQLRVSLASNEHFERYGLERSSIHARLSFEIVRNGGEPYIRVTTQEAVRDPFVSFLLEARWASGRLLREYTLLLDPPDFGPGQAGEPERAVSQASPEREQPEPAPEPSPRTEASAEPEPEPEPERPQPRRIESEPTEPRLGGRYGPVQRNQTLWNIADRLRPDGVSINQMMIALFEANPGAFEGNINRLRQGSVLRVPDRAELDRVSVAAANREASRQNEQWQQGRARVAEAPERERRDELRLVAPGEDEADAVGVGTDEARERIAELEGELDRVQEERAEAGEESEALRGRVSELETEIEELRRMLSLKDEQLASLQQRVRDDDLVDGLDEEAVFADEAETGDEPPLDEEPTEEAAEEELADAATTDEESGEESRDEEERVAEVSEEETADEGDQAPVADDASTEAERPARPQSRHVDPPGVFSRLSDMLVSPLGMGILGALVLAGGLGLIAVRRRKPAEEEETPEWDDELSDGDAAAAAEESGGDVEDVSLSDDLDELEGEDDSASGGDESSGQPDIEELLDEADFHVAYGTYDKAASMLEDALVSQPRDARLHLKLAETHFAAGNASAFTEAARRFRDQLGDEGDEWAQIARMGRDIAPDDELFAAAAGTAGKDEPASGDDLTPPEGDTLSDGMLNADQMEESIDLDLDEEDGGEKGDEEPAFDLPDSGEDQGGEDDDLSFDLPDVGEDADSAGSEKETAAEKPADTGADDEALDFGLDEESASVLDQTAEEEGGDDSEESDFPTVDVPPEKASEAFGTDSQAQFEKAFEELSAYVGKDEAGGDASSDFDWKRDEPGTTTEDDASPSGIDFGDDDDDELLDLGDEEGDDMGEIDTKIDLARAYIDMGDSEGAKGILEEVVEEGNEDQQKEAKSLLDSI